MLRTINKVVTLVILLIAIGALPSSAYALLYTRYDLTEEGGGQIINPDGSISSTQFAGYAIVNSEAIVTRVGIPRSFFIESKFLIPEFSITFDTGLVYSGSGEFNLVDTYGDEDGDGVAEWSSAEDYWVMGGYSSASGFGLVDLNLNGTSHNLLVSPVTTFTGPFSLNLARHSDASLPSFYGFLFTNPEPFPAPVPEPATWFLLAAGLCGVNFIRKRLRNLT